MNGLHVRTVLAGLCLGVLSIAQAEVIDSAAAGFTVRRLLSVSATPQRTYRSVVDDVGKWWDSAHTYSGNARNLSIEAVPGGCFCEKLPGGGVRHMVVLYADPGKCIRLSGGLGPLQSMAVSGSMTWNFTAAPGGGTAVEVIYTVGGYSPQGLQAIAPIVDRVLGDQLHRLKSFIEKGTSRGK